MTRANPTWGAGRPVRRAVGVTAVLLLALSACTPSTSGDPGSSGSGTTPVTSPPSTPATVDPTSPTSTDPEPLRIGLVATAAAGSLEDEIGRSVADAVDAAGAELVTCDPGADDAQLLVCLRRMTAQEVDGWVLVPGVDVSAFVCDTAVDDTAVDAPAGTSALPTPSPTGTADPDDGTEPPPPPLVVVGPGTGCELAVVGPDDTEVGETVGTALAAQVDDCTDTALVLVTDSTAPTSAERSQGIAAAFRQACPDLEPVTVDVVDQERAYTAIGSTLAGLPDDVQVLLAATDDTVALGAWAALPDTRGDRVVLASVGADLRARCAMRSDDRWIGDAALWPDRYGPLVVPALLAAIDGQEIAPELSVPAEFLTTADLDRHYPATECAGS